jgi:hypothetical protein
MHVRDLPLLESIKVFLGVGYIKTSGNFAYYTISSRKDLPVLFAHLAMSPLFTSKRLAYSIFLTIFNLIGDKAHFTLSGFKLIVAYINILNNPIKDYLLAEIVGKLGPLPPVVAPTLTFLNKLVVPSPLWIVGFYMGEGSFTYFKNVRTLANGEIRSYFYFVAEVSQKVTDLYVLQAILSAFGCGFLYFEHERSMARHRIMALPLLLDYVIPFFTAYPLLGFKATQYSVWLSGVKVLAEEPKWTKEREQKLLAIAQNLSALHKKPKASESGILKRVVGIHP